MFMRIAGSLAVLFLFGAAIPAEEKKAEKFDAAKMVGEWKITEGMKMGEKVEAKAMEGKVTIDKDAITIKSADGMVYVMGYKIDDKTTPAGIDMVGKEGPAKDVKAIGIIALDGDTLKLCYGLGDARPKDFKSTKEGGTLSFAMKKEKK